MRRMLEALHVADALRLLAVTAHPDDESLGLGGLLARCASEGVHTSLVTATRGQRGRFGAPDAPKPGPEEVGRVREGELRAAAKVLGVRDVTILDYMDGSLDQADARKIAGEIAAAVRATRPQVVVTFGPDGAYGHPDHIAICQFTTAGVALAADAGFDAGDGTRAHRVDKLYYMVWSAESARSYQAAFKKLTSKVDGFERQAVTWAEWAITTRLDTTAHWETVWRAIRCHETQLPGYPNLMGIGDDLHRELWGRIELYRAFSTVNGGRVRETDVFEGLR